MNFARQYHQKKELFVLKQRTTISLLSSVITKLLQSKQAHSRNVAIIRVHGGCMAASVELVNCNMLE